MLGCLAKVTHPLAGGSITLPKFISMPRNEKERWCVSAEQWKTRIFRPHSLHYCCHSVCACYLFEIEHIFSSSFGVRAVRQTLCVYAQKHPLGVSSLVLMEWLYYVNVIIFIIFVLFQHHEAHTHTHIHRAKHIKVHVEFTCSSQIYGALYCTHKTIRI